MNQSDNTITLNTGAAMPLLGLGTWNAARDAVGEAVEYALVECGYRHIDCAAVYHNEKEIGESLERVFKNGSVKRDDVFITSKLWNTAHRKEAVRAVCAQTLKDLRLEYLDLYLMHFPIALLPGGGDEPLDKDGYALTEKVSIQETWEAMEGLVSAGFVRAIGVSNFTAPQILDVLSYAKIPPAVNQIELHPYLQQQSLVTFCQRLGIAVTAYSPLGSYESSKDDRKPLLLEDLLVQTIARKHGKTPSQILLRFAIQRNTIAIPKSISREHIKTNADIFGFELSTDDMKMIQGMDKKFRFVNPEAWWKIPFFD